MPGKFGFDLNGASRSFNVLAEYLFGKVAKVVISVQIFEVYSYFLTNQTEYGLFLEHKEGDNGDDYTGVY